MPDLTYTSVLPYFLLMLVIFLFAAFMFSKSKFYQEVVGTDEGGRFESLDGLRGFLAINVFFQHAVTSYFYFNTGVWEVVPDRFYRFLGGEAVILFFIMTSFLYWSKAIHQKGNLDAGTLYRSRFLRLAPMYIFTAAIVTLSVFIQSGFNLDIWQTIKDIMSWLSIGLVTTTSVNGINIMHINAGIHWTLHFEWFFYLLLPILATALKRKEALIMTLPIVFLALSSDYRGYWIIFAFGIIAAHIYNKYPKVYFFSRPWTSVVPLVGLLLVLMMNYKPYSLAQYCVSLVVFMAFVYGSDLFGLLRTKTAKFLGTMSYSIYLVHGVVLFAVLHSVDIFYPITSLTPLAFWGLILVCGLATIIVSMFTYKYIEHPFILRMKAKKEPDQALTSEVM